MDNIREYLQTWIDQFENDHYVFDMYGEKISADVSREKVERIADISILLLDRVVEAKGDLTLADYMELEENVRREYPDDEKWISHLIIDAVRNDRLFGRYRDIEPMIAELRPRDYPPDSAAYLFSVRPELYKVIYATIRHVDDAEENYKSLLFTAFVGILTKGWGEGFGWSKMPERGWRWHNSDYPDEQNEEGSEIDEGNPG